jgi:hypothetical protein
MLAGCGGRRGTPNAQKTAPAPALVEHRPEALAQRILVRCGRAGAPAIVPAMATFDPETHGWLDTSDETPRVSYTATASQTIFAVPFVFHDADHLLVYDNDVLVDADDYVVTGEDDEDGGQIEFDTGITVSHIITIVRTLP